MNVSEKRANHLSTKSIGEGLFSASTLFLGTIAAAVACKHGFHSEIGDEAVLSASALVLFTTGIIFSRQADVSQRNFLALEAEHTPHVEDETISAGEIITFPNTVEELQRY